MAIEEADPDVDDFVSGGPSDKRHDGVQVMRRERYVPPGGRHPWCRGVFGRGVNYNSARSSESGVDSCQTLRPPLGE